MKLSDIPFETLQPCPFCGSKILVEFKSLNDFNGNAEAIYVQCIYCMARGPIALIATNPEAAVCLAAGRWNQRKESQACTDAETTATESTGSQP